MPAHPEHRRDLLAIDFVNIVSDAGQAAFGGDFGHRGLVLP